MPLMPLFSAAAISCRCLCHYYFTDMLVFISLLILPPYMLSLYAIIRLILPLPLYKIRVFCRHTLTR